MHKTILEGKEYGIAQGPALIAFVTRVGTFAGYYEILTRKPVSNFATTQDQEVEYYVVAPF